MIPVIPCHVIAPTDDDVEVFSCTDLETGLQAVILTHWVDRRGRSLYRFGRRDRLRPVSTSTHQEDPLECHSDRTPPKN